MHWALLGVGRGCRPGVGVGAGVPERACLAERAVEGSLLVVP